MSAVLRTQIKLKHFKCKEGLKSNDQAIVRDYENIKRELHSSLCQMSHFSDQINLYQYDTGKTWNILRTIQFKDIGLQF